MSYTLAEHGVHLRRPEPRDLAAILRFKNDPEVAALLGGFSTGYAQADGDDWLARRRNRSDELVYAIATVEDDACLGHVGLYQIDHRIRSAEFAIMLGEKSVWGKGIGGAATRWMVDVGFAQLNLNRVSLSVLASNERAQRLYAQVGFVEEGRLREGQYKGGHYHDVVCMSVLRREWGRTSQ
ncbi:GNAT family N-acetyltransferase [Enhygromyxa salina]|uniref:Putative ribosomal N-acetyltransferase YdaF n=1 Tax=Enhygromyxa salina TaxID=215803 RepID=A0A2S9YSP4_9BACT|nr:GNAT family protein [Enhygromyxa salina]PRQ08124.1 putative ribosomal N-acetyltransferase YdaF [Enhygromyxa salina]